MAEQQDTGQVLPNAPSPPATQRKPLHFGWTVAFVVAAILFMQWSTVEELYYPVSGTPIPESKIPWRHDYVEALAEAKQSGKPVLLVFGATWCPPCKRMKRQVWPDDQVTQSVESSYIPMYIDIDDPEQSQVVARYQVRSIPTVIVADSTGSVIQKSSTMSRSETLDFLAIAAGPQ